VVGQSALVLGEGSNSKAAGEFDLPRYPLAKIHELK